ncbi:MAG: RluA family pseudouridine synthase [Pseudomonadota bacterium]
MAELSKKSVLHEVVGEEQAGQRIDNYLLKILKGVPKSHVYRILRSGEVRVNSKRVEADYRLQENDQLRIPPVRTAQPAPTGVAAVTPRLAGAVLFEDEYLIALAKPAGMAVHGGSGVSFGVIEQMRRERPQAKFLELVHRLDRETSGVLLLAKKRSALTALHGLIRSGKLDKRYLTLVRGEWREKKRSVTLSLHKYVTAEGERRVSVDAEGQEAHTIFRLQQNYPGYSLLEAELKTGRTHQIRVHLAYLGYPIAGDDKYGDFALNKELARHGLKRMFLHAWKLAFPHPASGETLRLEAPLPDELQRFLHGLKDRGRHETL